MKLKTTIIRLLTKHADFTFLRRLYAYYFHAMSWVRYGDPYFPRIITIEISSHCNRACTYCPNVVTPQKPRLINEESFRKIVSRLREIKYNGVVDFIFFNEPTLHPKLAKYVEIVKKEVPWCMPRISTNGDLLTSEKVKSLVDAGLERVYVMRHVPTPEGWRENIDKLDKEFPGVFVKMDIEEVERTVGLNHFGGLVHVEKILKAIPNKDGSPSCKIHNHIAQITVDGDWDLCCTDWAKTLSFGSVIKRPIMDVWHDPLFVKMRKDLRGGKATLKVCQDCFVFSNHGKN